MDPAKFDEAVGPDPGFADHAVFEVEIRDGKWVESEVDDGVPSGVGWAGTYSVVNQNTFVAKDGSSPCQITYDLLLAGDVLRIIVSNEVCPDPNDILIQTAIYESATFHQVEAAAPTIPEPTPSAPPPNPLPTPAVSTARDRLTSHEKGSVEGADLGYLEYLPTDYGDASLSPLIVFLHGSGESGAGNKFDLGLLTDTAIPQLIASNKWPDDRHFVVLMPQHTAAPHDWCFSPDEIDSFLSFALAHYDIDPSRVYLTGLSCGAIGLWNYLGEHVNEVVAAAVPIAGYGVGAFDQQGCTLGQLPIWAFHGGIDPNVVLRGDVYPINSLNACTSPPPVDARITIFPISGHDVWTRVYDMSSGYDIYSWMLSHTK